MKKLILLVLLGLTLLGCSSNKVDPNKTPEWIDNPKSKYPESLYLAAVGYGSSRRAAEADAMGSVARIFETDVQSNSKYTERWKELSNNNTGEEISLFSENVKEVEMSADQNLINIEIGETFTNNVGRVYVLAYINRSRTSDIYDEKITQTDSKIKYYMNKAKSSSTVYQEYSFLSIASVYAFKNQQLLNQFSIISPMESQMVGIPDRFAKVQSDLREKASQISFSISIDNDENNVISNSVKEIISDLNFNIVDSGAMLQIDGAINFSAVNLKRKEEFLRYEFLIDISDNAGNLVVSLNEKGRTGGINKVEVKSKSRRLIVKAVKKNLEKKIISYFDSLAN